MSPTLTTPRISVRASSQSLHFRSTDRSDVINVFAGAYSRLPPFGLVPPFPSPSLSPASALVSPPLRDWSAHLASKGLAGSSEEASKSKREREWLDLQRDFERDR